MSRDIYPINSTTLKGLSVKNIKEEIIVAIGINNTYESMGAYVSFNPQGVNTISEKTQVKTSENVDTFSYVYTAGGDTSGHTVTYDKFGNSNLLNIHDVDTAFSTSTRDSYYRNLFSANTDEINKTMSQAGAQINGWECYSVERTVARYDELREEVINTFGHDEELLAKNLASLDKAFENNLRQVADSQTTMMEAEKDRTGLWERNGQQPLWEPHKLGTNKDFNKETFGTNAKNMMQQFAQKFLEQIKTGASSNSAMSNAFDFMSQLFNKTTSVNNLSFNDFMILQTPNWGDVDANTREGNIKAFDNNNKAFNNNQDLSEELRKLLE